MLFYFHRTTMWRELSNGSLATWMNLTLTQWTPVKLLPQPVNNRLAEMAAEVRKQSLQQYVAH